MSSSEVKRGLMVFSMSDMVYVYRFAWCGPVNGAALSVAQPGLRAMVLYVHYGSHDTVNRYT
jgi:hypothetical protein